MTQKKNVKETKKKPVKNKDDIKNVKKVEKDHKKREFKLKLARLDRAAAKEHRHRVRVSDGQVKAKMDAIAAEITQITGKSTKRPTMVGKLSIGQITEMQQIKTKS